MNRTVYLLAPCMLLALAAGLLLGHLTGGWMEKPDEESEAMCWLLLSDSQDRVKALKEMVDDTTTISQAVLDLHREEQERALASAHEMRAGLEDLQDSFARYSAQCETALRMCQEGKAP